MNKKSSNKKTEFFFFNILSKIIKIIFFIFKNYKLLFKLIRLFFKVFFILKYIKIIFFLLKIFFKKKKHKFTIIFKQKVRVSSSSMNICLHQYSTLKKSSPLYSTNQEYIQINILNTENRRTPSNFQPKLDKKKNQIKTRILYKDEKK